MVIVKCANAADTSAIMSNLKVSNDYETEVNKKKKCRMKMFGIENNMGKIEMQIYINKRNF